MASAKPAPGPVNRWQARHVQLHVAVKRSSDDSRVVEAYLRKTWWDRAKRESASRVVAYTAFIADETTEALTYSSILRELAQAAEGGLYLL